MREWIEYEHVWADVKLYCFERVRFFLFERVFFCLMRLSLYIGLWCLVLVIVLLGLVA